MFPNQKYAIVGLFASIQGASPITAYDEDVNKMVQSTIFSLGLSRAEVERYLQMSMSRNPERELNRIIDSLKEIRDKSYINMLYQKCIKIATISGDRETLAVVNLIFKELGM